MLYWGILSICLLILNREADPEPLRTLDPKGPSSCSHHYHFCKPAQEVPLDCLSKQDV